MSDNVKVATNAVGITDVPEGCTAVGVPAKIIKHENERSKQ